jgi:hypothetical protein
MIKGSSPPKYGVEALCIRGQNEATNFLLLAEANNHT